MKSKIQLCVALFVFLCISLACGQATQCSQSHTQPKLRFVAQLSVNGCPIFVHDTGAKDGSHLAVEPLMCVMQSLDKVIPRYDPVTQQMYVSIPVTLRDDAMLTEVQHQLQYLSPKSVKFATVSDISVSINKSSVIQILRFYWSPDEPTGTMRVWCGNRDEWCMFGFGIQVLRKLSASLAWLSRVTTEAVIEVNGTSQCHNYSLMMQNHSLIDPNIRANRYLKFPMCNQLRFVRSIRLTNCTTHVYQDIKGHFVIEPLLCHNITGIKNESTAYDYARDMYYLKLDVVLQDDVTLNAVRRELADLSSLNVSFMRLWQAEIVVASDLSRLFEIGPLQVSGDWRSGYVRVYCRRLGDCEDLRSSVIEDPLDLWLHVKWNVTSILSDKVMCSFVSVKNSYQTPTAVLPDISLFWNQIWNQKSSMPSKFLVTRQNRSFVVIQQRLTGNVSFQRGWTEYEAGFGDETDFWIGLSTIHSLSINGVTLRVEMTLMNGSELHYQEYAGFKVGDASTNYRMTCGGIILNGSSDSYDVMKSHNGKGKEFSTMDRDNDARAHVSCSTSSNGGNGGWWFSSCYDCNPNHVYGTRRMWFISSIGWQPLSEITLMLQI